MFASYLWLSFDDEIVLEAHERGFVHVDLSGAGPQVKQVKLDRIVLVDQDFRGKGLLRYVGAHHLRFDNEEWFVKGGADSPENVLAYADFDGTYNSAGTDYIKLFGPHVTDWKPEDPSWHGGKGRRTTFASGLYFCQLDIRGTVLVSPMLLLR